MAKNLSANKVREIKQQLQIKYLYLIIAQLLPIKGILESSRASVNLVTLSVLRLVSLANSYPQSMSITYLKLECDKAAVYSLLTSNKISQISQNSVIWLKICDAITSTIHDGGRLFYILRLLGDEIVLFI